MVEHLSGNGLYTYWFLRTGLKKVIEGMHIYFVSAFLKGDTDAVCCSASPRCFCKCFTILSICSAILWKVAAL